MKRKGTAFAPLMLCVMLVVLLTACGERPAAPSVPETNPVPRETGTQQTTTPETPPEVPESDEAIASVEELLESVAPGAKLVLASGSYNLSETLDALWSKGGEDWNRRHEYVQLQEVFDGVELVIRNADGLSIAGQSPNRADTELTVDPRYATVLTFENCDGVSLSNLTLGHTDLGTCNGNVLDYLECSGAKLDNLDIYGCGYIGLCAVESGEFSVDNSVLRDCEIGPFEIEDSTGGFTFRNCELTGSGGGGYYHGTGASSMSFYHCSFGEKESNIWYFDEEITAEDCTWSEITQYPDYSDWEEEPQEPDYENIRVIPFDEEILSGRVWTGRVADNQVTGEKLLLPDWDPEAEIEVSANLYLDEDGTGWLAYRGQSYDLTWSCDSQYSARLELEDRELNVTLYASADEGEQPVWMNLKFDDEVIWLN